MCSHRGVQRFFLDEMRVQMVCTHHAHQLPCCQHDIHISTAFTTHGRQICFRLLRYAGHDRNTADFFGCHIQLLRQPCFRNRAEHLLGRFCRRKLICQFRILPFQKAHPTGTAACEHGPTHQCAAFQPMQKFIAFLHNRQVCRKVCIIYIIEAKAVQRACHTLHGRFFPFQPEILAPSGTHRRRNLYDCNFFFICQSRSCLCGIISFS